MTNPVLHLDYETRSECDLFKEGAFNYAKHESTDIICLGYAFDEDPVELWHPGMPFPSALLDMFRDPAPASLHAHNAQFEWLITQYVLTQYSNITAPPLDAWYCTAAQARARALPGALDDLGRCLGLNIQKDKRGKELIKLLSLPQLTEDGDKRLDLDPDPDLLDEMYDYCRRDVEVERLAEKATPPLSEEEHDDWVVNEMVNARGLLVDVEFAAAATAYAEDEKRDISDKLTDITDGEITSPHQYQRIKDHMGPFIAEHDAVRLAMTRVEKNRKTGDEKTRISLDKSVRLKLLRMVEEDPNILPYATVEMIKLIDEAGKSSVHKYQNMVNRADTDGRVRGAYMFSGAGQTGRFSSLGLQLHNFPRRTADNPDEIRSQVMGNYEIPDVMDTLSTMLRPSIIAPPGQVLVGGDWSSIEARVLPWLTGTEGGYRVLEVFKGNAKDPSAPDVYMHAAADLYQIDPREVTKDQRAVGKVIILSAGYQGGYRAFQAMARAYNVQVTDDEASVIIRNWRADNSWCTEFWYALERAARDAMWNPGTSFDAGRITYCRPDPEAPLYAALPSGRILSYPQPRIEDLDKDMDRPQWDVTCTKAAWKPAQGETEWGRVQLYGGLYAENVTQAVAADILRHAMRVATDEGWDLVGHTHDELILEVNDNDEDNAARALERIMLDGPAWSEGLPLACETWSGRRYGK